MRAYITEETVHKLISVTDGDEELDTICIWNAPSQFSNVEIRIKIIKRVNKEGFFRKFRRAHRTFWRILKEKK